MMGCGFVCYITLKRTAACLIENRTRLEKILWVCKRCRRWPLSLCEEKTSALKARVKQLATGDLCAVQAVFASPKRAILASLFSRRGRYLFTMLKSVCVHAATCNISAGIVAERANWPSDCCYCAARPRSFASPVYFCWATHNGHQCAARMGAACPQNKWQTPTHVIYYIIWYANEK
jgi:hypothetical protein